MGGVGGVVDEIDLAQQFLLVMLEFAHHLGGVLAVLAECRRVRQNALRNAKSS